MNGKRVTLLMLAMVLLAHGRLAASQETVESLRGATPINEQSSAPQAGMLKLDRNPAPPGFVQQPPLIPHITSGYAINLKTNKRLTCHSPDTYEDEGATLISQTHFQDRDGKDLQNVSASRYFCTQCHVGQFDVKPLVGNDFEPVAALPDS